MFNKVLIANRGEIALRVIRACQDLVIPTAILYSGFDKKDHLQAKFADFAYFMGALKPLDTYMDIKQIIRVAQHNKVDAIHPGYGFLSENAAFAEACQDAGITFIGPNSKAIKQMGDKIESRKIAKQAGLEVVPGFEDVTINNVKELAEKIGYPVMLKASAGGGGRGMQVVYNSGEIETVFETLQQYAEKFFGNKTVFLEKYLDTPRHIEIQIMADKYGNVIHLGERECSIQRRNQKMIEEAPSPVITPEMRQIMGEKACALARAVGYDSIGTIEFIFQDGKFYFLEMNTRIQVEHPVTEAVTGIDLVKCQIEIAADKPLKYKQDDVQFSGHSIEFRICAENPLDFLPCPATITQYIAPSDFGVRIDSSAYAGFEVSKHFDSLISKLIVLGSDRNEAIRRMQRALNQFVIEGPKTTIPILKAILASDSFRQGNISTNFLENHPALFELAKEFVK